MKLYTAGPMRGYPDFNFPAFDAAEHWLQLDGHETVSPAAHDRKVWPDITSWPGYATGDVTACPSFDLNAVMAWDLAQVATADGIVLLEGWERSSGVAVELHVAKALGKRVFYLKEAGPPINDFYLVEHEAPIIIGLAGYAQVGKDTFGAELVKLGFERLAFADNVRRLVRAMDPIVGISSLTEEIVPVRISDIVGDDVYGPRWDKAKTEIQEVRRLQQAGGTEGGREIHGYNCWIDAAFRRMQPGGRYVITDVRFPNEAEAIKQAGGTVVRLHRDGTGPQSDHPSEREVDNIVPSVQLHLHDGDHENGVMESYAYHLSLRVCGSDFEEVS